MLRFVLQKLWAKKWMMLSLLIGNILMVAIACVNPMYTRAVLQKTMIGELKEILVEKGRYPGGVTVTASMLKYKGAIANQENFYRAQEAALSMDERLGVPVKETIAQYTVSNLQATSRDLREDDREGKRFHLAFLSDMEAHCVSLAGEGPGKEVRDGVLDVVVSEKGLMNLNLLVGETLDLEGVTAPDGSALAVRIAGVYDAQSPSDPYWVMAPGSYSTTLMMDEGLFRSLFVDRGEGQRIDLRGTWYALVDYAQMRGVDAQRYIDEMAALRGQFPSQTNVSVTDNFSDALSKFVQESKRVTATLLVMQAPIFALLAVFIFMVSRQLVQMEEGEIAVLKSRGASRAQVLLVYLVQGAVLALAGLAAGVPLSLFLCQVLGSANAFLEFVSRTALPAQVDAQVALCGLAAAGLSVATMLLPVIGFSRVSIVDQKRGKRGSGMAWWQKCGLDVALLGVSLYGLYSFGAQKELLYQRVLEGRMLDPLLFLSASLFILGAGLTALRVLPLLTRAVYFAGRARWSPALFASFLHVIRTKGSQGFLMVFLMFTIALGVFNSTAARTIGDNAERNTRYAAGADIVIKEAWKDNSQSIPQGPQGESAGSEEIKYVEPEYAGYTLLDGAKSVTRVLNDDNITLNLPGGGMLKGVRLMGINTKEFGQTAWFDESLLPVHWYHYLNAISQDASAILVSENMEGYGYKLGDVINYRNKEGKSARGVIYGFVPYFPTYGATVNQRGTDGVFRQVESFLIVAHLSQVQAAFGVTPYEVWISTGGGSTQFIYDYIEASGKKLRAFTDTQKALIEKKNDPVYQGTNGILTVGFIVVLVLCTVGFLIYWILSIRQRALQMGIFRAMGMSMREIVTMLVNEQIWISGLAIAAGAGIGAAAAKLYVPLIQIAYAASDQMVPLRVMSSAVDNARLLGIVGAVMVICLFILGWIVSRMKIAKALKLGED